MSLAKTHRVGKVRKQWTCGKCGDTIEVGQPAVKFAVGFRGRTQVRCDKVGCFPKPSERESSAVSSVYAAQEEANVSLAGSLAELEQIRDDVAAAARDVASDYEYSEMYDKNYDLQERADMLNGAADDLETWEPDDEAPDFDTHPDEYEEWLDAARDSLQSAIDEMELP